MFGFSHRDSSPPPGVNLPEGVVASLRQLKVDLGTLAPLLEPQRSNAYVFSVKGRLAPAIWESLHLDLSSTGYWPILLGGDEKLQQYRGLADDESIESPAQIVTRAADVNVTELLIKLRERHLPLDDPEYQEPEDGEWPDCVQPAPPFYASLDPLTSKPLPTVWFGLFPITDGSEAPAHLPFGDWNECPKPHEHVAMLKHWRTRYGAKVVAIAGDIVELCVDRRPQTRDEALALAREQYYYCADVVEQGVGSVSALAKVLMESDNWFFWWD